MSTRRLLYVAHDHLHEEHGILKAADPQHDVVILVESQRMLTGRPWHKERLFFLTSSARHFAQSLEVRGFTVRYIRATTTVDGLRLAQQEFGPHPIYSAQPSSHRQTAQLTEFGVQFVDNDFFLTSRTLFASWASQQRQFVMENFYRAQRVRLNLLMDGSKPEGGRWNFDADNRLPPPKHHEWPPYLAHERDALDLEVAEQLDY